MGLTQEALARLSGLSRSTVNAVEKQSIPNLSIAKAVSLLKTVGLSMIVATAVQKKAPPSRSALERAAATASVSYTPAMTAKQLKAALIHGDAPQQIRPHLQALLDEAPMSLLAKVVDEVHAEAHVERKAVWTRMRHLAHELKCFRRVWQ